MFDYRLEDGKTVAGFPAKRVLAVYTNEDLNEGKGEEYIAHFCEFPETAERLGKKRYVQGSDCPIKEVTLYLIDKVWYGPVRVLGCSKEDAEKRQLKNVSARIEAALKEAKVTTEELALYLENTEWKENKRS